MLQLYVKVFQKSGNQVHKLHFKQLQVFVDFLSCFIKPRYLQRIHDDPSKLVKLKINDPKFHVAKSDLYSGKANQKFMKEDRDSILITSFQSTLLKSFIDAGMYMQQKLPLTSDTLMELSTLDPDVRGHSTTVRLLKSLCNRLARFTPPGINILLETNRFHVDGTLANLLWDRKDVLTFWSAQYVTNTYPGLQKIAFAALSVFHGPAIESTFSEMGNIMEAKRGRLDVKTYDSYQTVRHFFHAENTSALEYFSRYNKENGVIDRQVCTNIRTAASKYKHQKVVRNTYREIKQSYYGIRKTMPASKVARATKVVRNMQFLRHKNKRALQVSAEQQNPKRKKSA